MIVRGDPLERQQADAGKRYSLLPWIVTLWQQTKQPVVVKRFAAEPLAEMKQIFGPRLLAFLLGSGGLGVVYFFFLSFLEINQNGFVVGEIVFGQNDRGFVLVSVFSRGIFFGNRIEQDVVGSYCQTKKVFARSMGSGCEGRADTMRFGL